MAAPPGVTLVQNFNYRGAVEEWSNTYHFLGSPPSDDAGWTALIDELTGIVAPGITSVNHIVRAYGYNSTDDHAAAFVYDIAGTGTGIAGSASTLSDEGSEAPGDCAAWIRWKTDYLNTKGKPVYLRKYYHGVWTETGGGNQDVLDSVLRGDMSTMGTALAAVGTDWPGLADPKGDAPGVMAVCQYITTRSLKRRGKRPS